MPTPLDRLRHHVTGAIERGEGQPITEWPAVTILPHARRLYACSRCGHECEQTTNHQGSTYSLGHFATCRACPPWAKYPEFGGSTVWNYVRDLAPGESFPTS